MINEKETIQISKFLSLVLRHQPEKIGLKLDEQGWTAVDQLLEKVNQAGIRLNLETLQHVVETNSKKRFAFDESGLKIRASQGHSVEVDLGYQPQQPPQFLYHGTAEGAVASILKEGIQRRKRHQVHLSTEAETATQVGSRHGKPVILRIKALEMHQAGHIFYCSANGVWLSDEVPPEFIVR